MSTVGANASPSRAFYDDANGNKNGIVRVFRYASEIERWSSLARDFVEEISEMRAGFSLELSDDGERICCWLGIQQTTPAVRVQDTFACTMDELGLDSNGLASMEHSDFELRGDVACVVVEMA
jgi:hypothetical protein